MEQSRFDDLARAFSGGRSRRSLLGALLAGVAALRGAPEVAAACRIGGEPCAFHNQCCAGLCLANRRCACSQAARACLQPAPTSCKKMVCDTAAGRCVVRNKLAGAACASDGNACTRDVCDGQGNCTHPPTARGTACASDGSACTRDVCDGAGRCTHPPTAAGTACADDGDPCTRDVCNGAGRCTHPKKAEGADCGGGRRCSGGVCATPPTCTRPSGECESHEACCGQYCTGLMDPPGHCICSSEGTSCLFSDDCCPEAPHCVGFVCRTQAPTA